MELNKYQIKFELMRLKKLKNELIEEELLHQYRLVSRQIYNQKHELEEAEIEHLLQQLAEEIKTLAKEIQ
jgi:hypothetical protein